MTTIFKNVRKHAASTSSKGTTNGGGGDFNIEYLPHFYEVGIGCLYTAAVAAPFNSRKATTFVMVFGQFEQVNDFSIVINGSVTDADEYSQINVIDDDFISNAESEEAECQFAHEYIEYLKRNKGGKVAVLRFYTGVLTDETDKCDIEKNGTVLFKNVPVCSLWYKECCD